MLDKNSPIPLVYQLEYLLCQKILMGEYRIRDFLPSQEQLAEDLNISRITVQNAFRSMIQKGILISQKGKGTYIENLPKINSVEETITINRDLLDLADSELLTIEFSSFHTACKYLQEKTSHYISHRRILNDYPMSIERRWFSPKLDIRFISSPEWEKTENCQQKLYQKLKIVLTKYEETLEPRIADDFLASQMMLPNANPLLCIKRLSYAQDQTIPFEYRETLIRYEDFGKIVFTPNWKIN